MRNPADDLVDFVAASPSPFHVVAEMARRLEAAGSRELDERERWKLTAGELVHVIRDGSLVALRIGADEPSAAGFRMVGAHTDSPTFKVRPRVDVRRAGYRLIGVEPYGGVLLYTWLDRDLTLAGRVLVADRTGGTSVRLVHLPGAPLRIPSLAIHLQPELRENGLKLDRQRHMVPVWGPDIENEGGLTAVLADELGVVPGDILGHDLVLADTQPPARGGDGSAYIFAPRLDNLSSCHAGLSALLAAEATSKTQVLVANDHEEVGSNSSQGAAGSFLADVVERVVAVMEPSPDSQALRVALARSWLVSADVAHAVHPNFSDRHEPEHLPRFGGGPVLKVNANQAYATDGRSGGWFRARCAEAGVPLQHFVSRADQPCGTTIGPLTATRLGVATVDVGAPVLSMHSCREQASADDVVHLISAFVACFAASKD